MRCATMIIVALSILSFNAFLSAASVFKIKAEKAIVKDIDFRLLPMPWQWTGVAFAHLKHWYRRPGK